MLMRPNKAETAVHDCHCPGYVAVHMHKWPDWLFKKKPRKPPWELILGIKRYGTGLSQRVSMEDGSSGNGLLTTPRFLTHELGA